MQVHRDETTGNILNLVLVEADEGTMLKVNLPVEFKGEDVCPGLKKGIGFLFIWQNLCAIYKMIAYVFMESQHRNVHCMMLNTWHETLPFCN